MLHAWGRKDGKCVQDFFFGGGGLEERDYLDEPDVGGSLIINWILERLDRAWTGFI
jgi:hypothetical protein